MKKNIIICTNLPVWSLDGNSGGRALYSTISGYLASGWSVFFITTGGNVPEEFRDKITLVEQLSSIGSKFRVFNWLCKEIKYRLNCNFYRKNCMKFLERCDYDAILYAYECEPVNVLKKISIKHNIKLVTRFQGTIIDPLQCNKLVYKIRKRILINALSTNSDLVIMTNDGTQGLNKLKEIGNSSKSIEFWRNGVNTIDKIEITKKKEYRKEYDINLDDFIFITVSRLEEWKRVDRAIIAFNEVYKTHKNIKLIIIGDGGNKEYLMNLVNKLHLSEVVVFKGKIEQRYVNEYLIMSDVFLSFYNLSNLGNPLFEAMMCGKPIITLDVGDTKTVITNNETGILIEQNQTESIPFKMQLLIDDKEFRDAIGLRAKKYADTEFYNWEERMKKEISKVDKLLKQH